MNLLIIRDFNKEKSFSNTFLQECQILDIKESLRNVKSLRKVKFNEIIVGLYDLKDKNLQYLLKCLLCLLQADKKYFIDNKDTREKVLLLTFLLKDTPLFILELIFDLLLVLSSWLGLFVFNLLPKRKRLLRSPQGSLAMTEKKIIYLRTDNFRGLQQGGSFTHFRGVVKGFYNRGYKIHYIGSGEIKVEKLDYPKTIIPYPLKFNLPEIPEIYYNWRFIPKALKIIKKEKPLFIYQRHSIFNICGAVLSQLTGIPLILEYNGPEPWVRERWGGLLIFKKLCYFMENFSLKKANLIVVVSDVLKEELLKIGIKENKILVNYNGVDPEEFNPNINGSEIRKKYNLEDKIVIGAVSTFGVWHGMPVLSQAVQLIIGRIQNTEYRIHFLFIGDGVQRPECERIIKESGMENYVTFTGIIPFTGLPKYLAACDILVASHIPNPDGTPFFGSPTKLFEYMAMGKGIVASDLDQIGEVLEHQKTAWLVKPGKVNDLANGIIQLINNKNLRDNLGNNAYTEVQTKYKWEENAKRIIDFFLTKI